MAPMWKLERGAVRTNDSPLSHRLEKWDQQVSGRVLDIHSRGVTSSTHAGAIFVKRMKSKGLHRKHRMDRLRDSIAWS